MSVRASRCGSAGGTLTAGALLVLITAIGGCTQEVTLGHADDFGIGGSKGDGGAGGEGGAAPVPAELAAETCAARAGCADETSCVHDTTCILEMFRPELRPAFAQCSATACGKFDDCWLVATTGVTPPSSFQGFRTTCLQRVPQCEDDPKYGGEDWCDYDFVDAADYDAMLACIPLPCGDIVACMRTVIFAGAPECTSL